MLPVKSKTITSVADGKIYVGFLSKYYDNLMKNNAEMARWRDEAVWQLKQYYNYEPVTHNSPKEGETQ